MPRLLRIGDNSIQMPENDHFRLIAMFSLSLSAGHSFQRPPSGHVSLESFLAERRALKMDKADCLTLLGIYGDEAKMRFGFLIVARGHRSAFGRQDSGRTQDPDARVFKIDRVECQSLFAQVSQNLLLVQYRAVRPHEHIFIGVDSFQCAIVLLFQCSIEALRMELKHLFCRHSPSLDRSLKRNYFVAENPL